jgi:hypothetical protein
MLMFPQREKRHDAISRDPEQNNDEPRRWLPSIELDYPVSHQADESGKIKIDS